MTPTRNRPAGGADTHRHSGEHPDDEILWALGTLAIAPLIATAEVLAWLVRRPHIVTGAAASALVAFAAGGFIVHGPPGAGDIARHLAGAVLAGALGHTWRRARSRHRNRRPRQHRAKPSEALAGGLVPVARPPAGVVIAVAVMAAVDLGVLVAVAAGWW